MMDSKHSEHSVASSADHSSVAACSCLDFTAKVTAGLQSTYRFDERLTNFSLTHSDVPSLSEGGVRLSPQFVACSLDAFILIAAESMSTDSS